MAVHQSTTPLTNSVRTLYANQYVLGAEYAMLYDQLATPVAQYGVEKAARLGNTITIPFMADVPLGTSVIPETEDVVPTLLDDATASLTPTSRWVSVQWNEHLEMDVYTDATAQFFKQIGRAMEETIDVLPRDASLAGSLNLSVVARASLDAGTTTHYMNDLVFEEANMILYNNKAVPFMENARPQYLAIMPYECFYDLRQGGNVLDVAKYQRDEILLNYELGQLGPFKILVSPFAKVIVGQGAANATAVSTTTTAAISPLDTSFVISSTTNLGSGYKWLNIIDTAETSTTYYTTNERVKYVSDASSTVTIVGQGANGGFRFAHASGVAVTNADSVYPVVYGGVKSLVKAYDAVTGEYGKFVGPKVSGLLDQFKSYSAKFYGGYGRLVESWILRSEHSSSLEA